MAREPASLRTTVTLVTTLVTALALLVCCALVALTTYLNHLDIDRRAAAETLRLAQRATIALLRHGLTDDAEARRALATRMRTAVEGARGHARTAEETHLVDDAADGIARYLEADRAPGAPHALLLERRDAASRALDALREAGTARIAAIDARAHRWEGAAEILGVVTGLALVALAGGFLWWLRLRAFRPVFDLAAAMARFGQGDRLARAHAAGAAELQQMSHQFNEMATALAAQREAQAVFLGGVAHDLRTPLATLRLAASMAPADEPLPPEGEIRRIVARVERQAERIDRMVGDFLDLSRIESGHLELDVRPQDARPLVQEALEAFDGTSAAHPLIVTLPDEEIPVVCDRLRIEQVITNLVSNAVKYSPEGGSVAVELGRDGDRAVLRVRDQGIGITPIDVGRLFEPFRRVGSGRHSIPGTGLGLFVVRGLVEAHGGEIRVQSQLGRGSTFLVSLPLASPPSPPPSSPPPPS